MGRAKTFDGKEKDPIHYDLNHPLEPQIKELWAALGFTVNNDVDVLAAKHEQLHRAVPGCMLQVMNEDDVFGLVHADDKQIFQTDTDDPRQNAVHYGRGEGRYWPRSIGESAERCPDGADNMPLPASHALLSTPTEPQRGLQPRVSRALGDVEGTRCRRAHSIAHDRR